MQAYNLKGELYEMVCEELPARVWQHEIDHLDGHLFIDKMGMVGRMHAKKYLKQFEEEYLEAQQTGAIDAALAQYQKLGATLVDITLPRTELSIPVYYVIAPAEASSNLSRFDGVKFGHRAKDFTDLVDMYKKTRAEGFGDEVQRRILIGTYVLSAGFYDAYYTQAQKVRTLIARDFDRAWESCDLLLTPTAPSAAFGLGEKSADPLAMYLNDVFTVTVNLAGLPGVSVPVGLDAKGLPLGLQLIGRPWDEAGLLNHAYVLEQAAGFVAKPAKWW